MMLRMVSRSTKALRVWLGTVGVGILANVFLHRYRLYLYDHDTDYPEFHPLQELQYKLYWATNAVMVLGALWFVGAWIRRRFK